MSTSLPSYEIYAVDVPEVRDFSADFKYNFFTPDESVSETGGVPTTLLARPAGEADRSFVQYSLLRSPRFVLFSFSTVRLGDIGNIVSDAKQRANVFGSGVQDGSLISRNLDKVISEDHFAASRFAALNFHDGEIDDKVHYLVSGSYVQHTLEQTTDTNVSHYRAAQRLQAILPKSIKPQFLYRAMALPSRASGTRFFDRSQRRVFNQYFRRLKSVSTNAQVNGKLLQDIVGRSINDPHAPFAADLGNVHQFSRRLKQSVTKLNGQVSESDYKTFVPYFDIVADGSLHNDLMSSEMVGYIIDKQEIRTDGSTLDHPSIVIDNPNASIALDFRVRYSTTYVYSIRSVAQFTVPAIDDSTGDTALIKVLVSSKPSNRVYVEAVENVSPPPPNDLNFTWDYERLNPATAEHDPMTGEPLPGTGDRGSLLVHWTFPTNSQRDIKKFQVFRRRSTSHPFELVRMYDFDDSYVKFPTAEDPDPRLVDHLTSPTTFFFDDDFGMDSKYIYAVASIDAHGLTSNYSAQFEVWFDRFSNKLQKRLVSHSGAPKPYPNLYLEGEAFTNTIRVSGANSKRAKLYFNPEFYYLYDDQDRMQPAIATKQAGGKYSFQFINLDNQQLETLSITVDDRTSQQQQPTRQTSFFAGPRRLASR